jgi:hypothetical protein
MSDFLSQIDEVDEEKIDALKHKNPIVELWEYVYDLVVGFAVLIGMILIPLIGLVIFIAIVKAIWNAV